jgi:hypothetical protein
MDEGDAALTHSGGALGMFLGGLGELAYRGATTADVTPYTGAGYGTAIGLVAAGTIAEFVQVSPSRVMLVDLGTGLGALAGAAAGSPLVFQDVTEAKARGFALATLGGAVAGGGIAWLLTRDAWTAKAASFLPVGAPTAGVIGASATRMGATPAYGVGWQGSF